MIDKTTYEAMKRENRYGLPLFYDYYLEHLDRVTAEFFQKLDYEDFCEMFPKWVQSQQIDPHIYFQNPFSIENILRKCTRFYDQKFGL